MKSVLIIGAGGFIGSAIAERMRREDGRMNLLFGTSSSGRFGLLALDVTNVESVKKFQQWLVDNEVRLHAIVYAAGSCKKGGFQEEATTAKKDMDRATYRKKSTLFGVGLINTVMGLLPSMENEGHIVVISSATEAEKPPFYTSERLYGGAIGTQEGLIRAMRENQLTLKKKNIRTHRIAPGAVKESPFYDGCDPELLPERMVPVAEVADAVMQAINMPTGYMDTNFFADACKE